MWVKNEEELCWGVLVNVNSEPGGRVSFEVGASGTWGLNTEA